MAAVSLDRSTSINDRSVMETAKRYVGFVYDERNQSPMIGGQRLGDLSGDDLEVWNQRPVYHAKVKNSFEKCENFVNKTLSVHAAVPIGEPAGVILNGGLTSYSSSSDMSSSESYSCAVVCLKVDKCGLKNFSNHKLIPGNYSYSTGIITSGTCYVGYVIKIQMIVQRVLQEDEGFFAAEAEISAKRLASIGVEWKNGDRELQGKTITAVHIRQIEEIGDYCVPKIEIERSNFLTVLEQIRENFNENYKNCSNRRFYIDEVTNVRSYTVFLAERRLSLMLVNESPSRADDVSNSVESEEVHDLAFFKSLSEQIRDWARSKGDGTPGRETNEFLERVDQALHGKESDQGNLPKPAPTLSSMFFQINSIFSSQLDPKEQQPYTLVLGETGDGKSTLVGYLLGYAIGNKSVETKSGKTRKVLDYQEQQQDDLARPVIGHSASETRGVQVYGPYIDTAGFGDSSGPEADICNAVAIQMSVNYYQPKKVIVILPSNHIFQGRGEKFRTIVETLLSQVIINPTRDEIWPNILFLINDKGARREKEDLEAEIDNLIDLSMEERNKLIDSEKYSILLKEISWKQFGEGFKNRPELASLQEDENFVKIKKHQEVLEIISKIEVGKNVLIANFSTKTSKKSIEKFLKRNGSIPSDRLNVCGVCPGSQSKFYAVRDVASAYFDFLERRKILYSGQLNEIEGMRENCSHSGGKEVPTVSAADKGRLSGDLEVLKQREGQLKKSIENLKNNGTPMEWPELLAPKEPITPRYPWAVSDDLARKYMFGCGPEIPELVKCKYKTPNKEHPGKFSILPEVFIRTRQVEYTPAWWGHDRNCTTRIRLYVKAKDHLDTRKRKQIMVNELSSLRSQIKGLEISIARHERLLQGLALQAERNKEEEALISEMKKIQGKYNDVRSKLERFGKFNALIKEISSRLKIADL